MPSVLATFGNGIGYRSALVSGSSSLWTNGVALTIGTNAQVTVDAGGKLAINGALTLANMGTVANGLIVTNGGRITTSGEFIVGTGNTSNRALIAAGGQVYSLSNVRVGNNAGGHQNTLVVRGDNALLDVNAQALCVGYHASVSLYSNLMIIADNAIVTNCSLNVGGGAYNNNNSLLVTNGGKLFSKGVVTYIGSTGSSNSVAVVGGTSASLWNNGGQQLTLVLANGSRNNSLVIDGAGAGAMVTNVTTFQIGGTGAGMCNSLIVTNGGILVYGSAALDNNGLGYDNSNNTFAIAMGGKVYARGATSYVGEYGPASSNLMSIRDPGSLFDGGGGSITIGAYNYGAMGNILIIDNDGQVTNCSVNVGGRLGATSYNPLWNRMVITNGGKLFGVAGANNTIGGNVGGSYNSAAVNSNSLWNVAGGALIVGQGTNNSLSISDGGLVTNAASVYVGYVSPSAVFNRLVITNGGKLYSKNVCGIGCPDTGAPAYGQSSNTASVTGPNSVWDLGGASLTVGYVVAAGAATGNVLTIDQGGLVDNIGTLTVGTNNNAVKLYGGTLGLASAIYSNSLFTVGDGLQAATLKTLGGTVNFMSGLRITNNAVLTGIGTVSGGGAGVTLTNGATIAPGLPGGGVGTLTIGGSNLIWRAGATYVCEIIDMKLGPGLGWDLLNVSSQLVLNGTGLGIKITGTPVNFDAGKDYNLRILNYGTQAGYSLTTFTLDATTFTPASSWIVTNTGSAIWLVYRGGAAPSGASLTWSVPNSGSWSVNGNWTGGTAPGAGGNATNIMVFGDNGTAYNSTNDYPGLFANNQLQLSSASSATNYIKGGALLFANNGEIGARIDYLSGNSGAFTISNNVLMANDTEFGGNAFGGTVVMAGNVTNMGTLTKKGAWTLALAGNNDLRGDLLIDSPDGTLRLDSTAVIPQTPGLGNAPNLIVSNGTLYINHGGQNCSLLMNTPNRSVLVTGSGSVWSNTIGGSSYLYLADGITNAAVTITAGGKLFTPAQLYVSQNGGSFNSLIITNGGQVTCGGSGVISDSNNQVVITGSGSFWKPGAAVSITGTNNLLQLDNGGLLNNTVNMGGVNNTFVVSNGLISSSAILVNGVGSRATLTGSNTLALLVASSYIGNGAGLAGNMVTVNGGAVATGVSWYVGAAIGSRNGLIVTNGGKMFIAGLNVGNNASSNFVIVTGPNSLLNGNTAIGYVGSGPAGVSNTVTVDDRAIVTNISWQLNAVATSRWSQVAVANGGQMSAGAAASYVSYAAFGTNNTIVVTGSNSVTGNQSVWNSQGQNLIVANGGTNAGNGVVIQDGGMMTNVGNFNLAAAAAAGSSNNYLTVDGGILQASTLTCSNSLPNWVTLNGACLVTVSNLVLTNAGQIVTFKGGTLNLVSATISSGQAQVVGDGTQSAVLNLLPGGTNSFTDGLVITNQATLSGSGLIAASSAVYGTLSPGAGIGAITSRGDFTLKPSASTTIEMGAYTTPGAGWDLLTVASGALNLGGSLKVLLNGGFAPAITQSYLVMTNLVPASVSGTFAADTAAAYTNASMSGTPAGRFKVAVGTQGVTLHSYAAWKPAGAMIFIW
ncbi:MAG: hypothetical protein WCL16_02300 [bacterium]